MKHFISLQQLSANKMLELFQLAKRIEESPLKFSKELNGQCVGLLFEKPSLRTRVSFEVGIHELGAKAIYLSAREVQLGKRESAADIAKTLNGYLDAVILRTFSHKTLLEFAKNSKIPVINGLTDLLHPAQALSDFYTIYSKKKDLKDLKITFIGDGNNVCNSLLFGAAKLGLQFQVASPKGFAPDQALVKEVLKVAKRTKAKITFSDDIKSAAKNADVLYTDVWVSMGDEKEDKIRKKAFKDFQINSKVLRMAKKNCMVLHCLPAHRGEEITDKVIDSKSSFVFQQAENRLYIQKAIMLSLFKKGKR
jgi:ornithine carbamoyltransferase